MKLQYILYYIYICIYLVVPKQDLSFSIPQIILIIHQAVAKSAAQPTSMSKGRSCRWIQLKNMALVTTKKWKSKVLQWKNVLQKYLPIFSWVTLLIRMDALSLNESTKGHTNEKHVRMFGPKIRHWKLLRPTNVLFHFQQCGIDHPILEKKHGGELNIPST